jgi:hypothetical protein
MPGLSHPQCYKKMSFEKRWGGLAGRLRQLEKRPAETDSGNKKGADQRRLSSSNTVSRTETLKNFSCRPNFVSSDPRQHELGPFASGQTLGGAPGQCIGNYPLCLTFKTFLANKSVSER